MMGDLSSRGADRNLDRAAARMRWVGVQSPVCYPVAHHALCLLDRMEEPVVVPRDGGVPFRSERRVVEVLQALIFLEGDLQQGPVGPFSHDPQEQLLRNEPVYR